MSRAAFIQFLGHARVNYNQPQEPNLRLVDEGWQARWCWFTNQQDWKGKGDTAYQPLPPIEDCWTEGEACVPSCGLSSSSTFTSKKCPIKSFSSSTSTSGWKDLIGKWKMKEDNPQLPGTHHQLWITSPHLRWTDVEKWLVIRLRRQSCWWKPGNCRLKTN